MATAGPSVRAGLHTASSGSDDALAILSTALAEQGSTSAIAVARERLTGVIRQETSTLVGVVTSHVDRISDHLTRGDELAANAAQVHRSLSSIEQGFNVNNPQSLPVLSQFLTLSGTRQISAKERAEAELKATVLGDVARRYNALVEAEDAVWSGRGAEDTTLALLTSIPEVRSGPSKVETEITTRLELLRALVSDQLASAWKEAIVVGEAAVGSTALIVKRSIKLRRPRAARSTPSSSSTSTSSAPTYTVTQIGRALAQLGGLSSLLHEMQGRIIRNIVDSLVNNDSLLAETVIEEGQSTVVIRAALESAPLTAASNVRVVMGFVGDEILPPSDLDGREGFLASLQQAAFDLLLNRILLPAMPLSLDHIPAWLQLVRQSAEWEGSLSHDPSGPNVLLSFLDHGAGHAWLDQRRQHTLRQTRRLIYDNWSSWKSKTVEETPEETKSEPAMADKQTEAVIEDGPIEEDDGWGFDDTKETGREDEDGWAFDDLDTVPAPPVAPIAPPKPVREAKRLGKKVGGKAAQSTLPVEGNASEPRPPSPPAPVAEALPTPPATQADSYQVSVICDKVIGIASSALSDMEVITSSHSSEGAFTRVPEGLSHQLSEALDMIRATVPVVYSARLRSTPAIAFQLGNDFRYISRSLADCEPSQSWAYRAETVGRFASAANLVYNASIEEQVATNGAILLTADFSDCTRDITFTTTSAAIEELVSRINTFAAVIRPVVGPQRFSTAVGSVINSATGILLDRVLGLEDITELESERLGGLLSHVETLDQLFVSPGGMSNIATYVPHWFKFCYTNQLLGANLVDITYLFEHGSLVDFTSEELSRLIRALFADSPKRSSLLDKVDSLPM